MAENIPLALGQLICDLNTTYPKPMDIYVDNPYPPPVPPATDRTIVAAPSQIEVEVDDEYTGEWSFKKEPQTIARALRIKVRYPLVVGGTTYWQEDYLLIGYVGGGI